jgi:hypothetical protein
MTRNDNADMMRAFPSISPPSLSLSLFSPLLKELTVYWEDREVGLEGEGCKTHSKETCCFRMRLVCVYYIL